MNTKTKDKRQENLFLTFKKRQKLNKELLDNTNRVKFILNHEVKTEKTLTTILASHG